MIIRTLSPLLLVLLPLVQSFSSLQLMSTARSGTTALKMAPKFDQKTGRWTPTKAEEGPEAGYGPGRTLLLHGPKPFYHRVFETDNYEQAVLKFMASDKCTRDEAQGNMDAYLRNPNDWAYNRMEEQRLGIKIDYTTIETKEIALVVVWSLIVFSVVGRVAVSIATGTNFWSFLQS